MRSQVQRTHGGHRKGEGEAPQGNSNDSDEDAPIFALAQKEEEDGGSADDAPLAGEASERGSRGRGRREGERKGEGPRQGPREVRLKGRRQRCGSGVPGDGPGRSCLLRVHTRKGARERIERRRQGGPGGSAEAGTQQPRSSGRGGPCCSGGGGVPPGRGQRGLG